MLHRDYLVQLLTQFFEGIRRSLEKSTVEKDPRAAADSIEETIQNATDIDGAVLLSLAPESMASVIQVSGTDPEACGFIANSLELEAHYLAQAGDGALSKLRLEQARALADAYGFELAGVQSDEDAQTLVDALAERVKEREEA